ncbi:hypothetical protein [Candidatus Carsonella ruddii]|uniref:Uncharacterized protein n=1 Tax=Candidatus Carsonella ruddii HC isolate Thao2000 TaxID=1202538 RepID=J3TEB2_CARRU|nr:hypothetical protein [Candidatus Carsonella ruddii]AFP83997.1 hypothetical protein A353_0170 [Candidatus Carsonella ruddii HC isolate Thao2000]
MEKFLIKKFFRKIDKNKVNIDKIYSFIDKNKKIKKNKSSKLKSKFSKLC